MGVLAGSPRARLRGGARKFDASSHLKLPGRCPLSAARRQIGSSTTVGLLGFCIRISPTQGSWTCEWTTFLAKGQINVAGPFYDTKNSVLAITGGTGAYRKARGEMNLNSLMGGKEYDFIFHLN